MFPFQDPIAVEKDFLVSAEAIHKHVLPLLTPERRQKIEKVVEGRTFNNVVVLEDIYDRGNISAVMRSAEAMGFAQVHLIEKGEKFKESQRTTAGADKWVETKRWKTTRDCVASLKQEGKRIVVTHLDSRAKLITEVDFTKPTALVLGNEKDGASPEMIELADETVILPMVGFVQSYNISVAGALCFYSMMQDRLRRSSKHGDLTEKEKFILQAIYALRTLDSASDILRAKESEIS